MYSQTLKKKKLSNIIIRGFIFFALLSMMLYPACAGGLDSNSQTNPVTPESKNSSGSSESSNFSYYDANGSTAIINLSLQITTLNPEFLDYLQNPENWESQHYGINGKLITLGMIPSPTSIYWPDNYTFSPDSELGPSYFPQVSYPQSAGEYPNELYFSLVDAGRITSVKDQGSAGSCGIYAAYASLESYLIPIDSYQWDFSENNMKNLLSKDYPEGFDRTHDAGAGSHMATAYLTRWTGPILESDDPYNPTSGVSPTNKPVQKHVQEVVFLPPRNNSTDNSLIKKTIKEKGGIWAAFDVDWNRFGSKNGYDYVTYYNPTLVSSSSPNGHAICIVGWDDNFSRYEFTSTPPGNGAFICKNSWGTGSGINGSGYFYISYYDANLGMKKSIWSELCVYEGESPNNYKKIYQYDPLGWTTEYGYNNLNYAWAANVFKANSGENLKAIGFYTPMPNVNYEVHIYSSPSSLPVGGTEVYNSTGIFEFPGYHTIPIEQVIPLSTGQKFSIVIKISSESNIKFPAEYNFNNYSSKASAHPGESYISLDGTSWEDVTKYSSTTNFCIKAYTSAPDTQSPVIRSVTLNNTTPKTGDLIRVTVNATDNAAVSSVGASGNQLTSLGGNLWQGTITAIEGTHSVNVSARDAAGNIAWNNSTSYTANTPDTQPPVIRSVTLNNTTPKTGDLIRATINATDNVNLTSVEASGSQLTYSSGNLWQGTMTAVEGTHSVNVSARDAAGNIAWNNSTGYTANTPDTQPPVIRSVTLNNTTPKTGDFIRATINATDNVNVTSVEASGNQLTSLGGNLWQGTMTAVEGTHSVNVSARDTAGNIAWNNSTSYTANTPDTQPPVIRSVTLNNTTPKTGDLIRVTVNATDNGAVSSVEASGSQLTYSSGNLWQGTITAIEGTHSVNVSARDTAGNIAWNNSTSYTATKQDTGNGLVVYYDGNLSGNSLVDLSGNNNTGYATNVIQGTQITGANYISFNGVNSKIDIPNNVRTNISGPITVEFIGSINTFRRYGALVSKYSSGPLGWYVSSSSTSPYNNSRFSAVMERGFLGYNSNISLVSGKVYDIVATYDNNVSHIYVNGIESARAPAWNSPVAGNNKNITIGSGYGLNYTNCSMYTFRLYNRSLSSAEVLQNYNNDHWRCKATPAITWSNPASITYGTALNSTQLNAAASDPLTGNTVSGSFVYTPAAGTVLRVGAHTLHVDFSPADAANYTNASKDVTINVRTTEPVTDGLVVYYDGNLSGNSLVDLSGNNNTGYATRVTQRTNQSTGARYVNLNGISSKIDVSNNEKTNISGPITVEFIGSINTFRRYGALVSKYSSGPLGWYVSSSPTAPYNNARFSAVMKRGFLGYNSNISLVSGKVYDIVATYDNNVSHIYVNGIESAAAPEWNSPVAGNNRNITIGSGYGLNYTNCSMYTFKLYNRSLSSAEVLQNYKSDRWRYTD